MLLPRRATCASAAAACSRRLPPPSARFCATRPSRESTVTRKPVRLRLEAHHAAGQQARRRRTSSTPYKSFGYEPEYPVVRDRARRARRPDRQRHRHAAGHREPRARSTWSAATTIRSRAARAPTTIRRGRQRCWRRRASWRGRPHARNDHVCLVHRRRSRPARQPRVRAAGGRRARCRSSARSTTTWSARPTIIVSTTRSATRTPASATSSTPRRSCSPTSSPTTRTTTRAPTPPPTTTPTATSSAASARIRS